MKVFTPDFNVALIVTVIAALGTYFMVPPFSWVITRRETIKDGAAVKYGEPPYGHAELSSLKAFTQKLNLDLSKSMDLLDLTGYAAEDDQVTLAALAKRCGVSPQQLYQTIQTALKKTADEDAGVGNLPDSPPPGTGNLLPADFCARDNLTLKQIIRDLNAQNSGASADMSLKQIAADKGIRPTDLYEIIKALAASV